MAERRSTRRDALAELIQVGATWAAVSRVLERSLREANISLEQALAVLQIATTPQPLLLHALAERLFQQPQSITSLMDRLEQAGWAQRVQDLLDRRAIRVELTEAGGAKAAAVGSQLLAAATQVLASVDGHLRDGLPAGLSALYEACRMQPGVRLPELPRMEAKEGGRHGGGTPPTTGG